MAWHVFILSDLYCQDAVDKWHQYPPPDNGSYAYPWLWVDGVQRGWESQFWRGFIEAELNQPTSVGINLSGSYDPGLRTGWVQMEFVNSSSSPLSAVALVAITEDSIYYPATNGDVWHNHVLRDYVPSPNGTAVLIPALGQDTLTQDFTLDPSWNDQRCNVVVYLQDPNVQPDSSRPVYQGGIAPVMQLSGVAEKRLAAPATELTVFPNPCRGMLHVRAAQTASLKPQAVTIRDAAGRIVWELELGACACASFDLSALPGGIYFVSAGGRPNQGAKFLLTR